MGLQRSLVLLELALLASCIRFKEVIKSDHCCLKFELNTEQTEPNVEHIQLKIKLPSFTEKGHKIVISD